MYTDYFSAWSGPMSYILGYLFADGSVYKTRKGGWYLSVQTKDRSVLEYIKRELKARQIIAKRRALSGDLFRLQVGSRILCEELKLLGYIRQKTHRMRLPKIPKRFLADFVRGYFDGDGNVWVGEVNKSRKKPVPVCFVSFTSASKDFLLDLRNSLVALKVKGSMFPVKNTRAWRISFSTRDALKIARFMYNTGTSFCLIRKKRVFERYVRW